MTFLRTGALPAALVLPYATPPAGQPPVRQASPGIAAAETGGARARQTVAVS
jgi:hypothetical protein